MPNAKPAGHLDDIKICNAVGLYKCTCMRFVVEKVWKQHTSGWMLLTRAVFTDASNPDVARVTCRYSATTK